MLIFTYFITTYGLLCLLFTLPVNLLFTVKKISDLLLTLKNLLVNFHLLTSKNHDGDNTFEDIYSVEIAVSDYLFSVGRTVCLRVKLN